MSSITKIFILITAIIVISGEELDISKDTDESTATVPNIDEMTDTLNSMKNCNGIYGYFGCITTDRSVVYQRIPNYYDVIRPKTNSDDIEPMETSKSGIFWWLRQRPLDTSLLTISSSTSKTNNRNRRSAPSTNKNPAKRPPPDILLKDQNKMSVKTKFMYMLLATIASPYFIIVPNKNYQPVETDQVYTS